MIDWPKDPSGNSPMSIWLRKFLRACKKLELLPGADHRIRQQPNGGFFLENVRRTIAATGDGTPSAGKMFKITTIPDGMKDYFLAKEWDGTTLGSTEIAIAKQVDQRPSIVSRSVLGIPYSLTYSSDNIRVNTLGSVSQHEQCVMPFEVDEYPFEYSPGIDPPVKLGVIFALPVSATGVLDAAGDPVTWIDLTPRFWGRFT